MVCESLYQTRAGQMLSGELQPEQYHYLAGYCKALEQVAALPDTLASVIARADERHSGGPDRAEERIFYGSPYYQSTP